MAEYDINSEATELQQQSKNLDDAPSDTNPSKEIEVCVET